MTNSCSPQEFDRQIYTLLSDHNVADPYFRADVLKGFLNGLRRYDYLSVKGHEATMKNDPMFEVALDFPVTRRQPEWVQQDLTQLWTQLTSKGDSRTCAFRNLPKGFEALLLCKFKSTIITGRITVTGIDKGEFLSAVQKSDRFF